MYDNDNDDAYQAAGDGDDDRSPSSGGGVFGYSDTYPYEDDEDKDDRFMADDDKNDETLIDDDDDMLETKSEVYVQSGTDSIPDDMRSPELVDVPVDAKEAAADQFMKSRELESDHIFGGLEHSQQIAGS